MTDNYPITPLSQAARAVLTAVTWKKYDVPPEGLPAFAEEMAPLIAAALRAAANQVVPVTSKPNDEFCCPPVATIVWNRVMEIRKHFLVIATELENTNG